MTSTRSKEEIRDGLNNQLSMIENSCSLFDKGYDFEALRIATAILTVLDNLSRSKNLKCEFLSTIPELNNPKKFKFDFTENDTEDEIRKQLITLPSKNQNINIFYAKDTDKYIVHAQDKSNCLIMKDLNEFNTSISTSPIRDIIAFYHKSNKLNSAKSIIISHLSYLLGLPLCHPSGFNPMIDSNHPLLDKAGYKRFINLTKWKEEIIFCALDGDRLPLSLTREALLRAARNKDGGAHFDNIHDQIEYNRCKERDIIAYWDGKEISIQNNHLNLLRQLGYEILNSKFSLT